MTAAGKCSITMIILIMAFMVVPLTASAADRKIRVRVPGITWASSALAASDAAKSVAGVSFVDDDMINATLTIIFDDSKTDLDAIKAAMEKAGFPVEGDPEFLK